MDPISRQRLTEEIEAADAADRKKGEPRSWAAIASDLLHCTGEDACPETPGELLALDLAHGRLGRDANGSALVGEMRQWWDEHGVSDPGLREAYEELWRAIEQEDALYLWERREEARQGLPGA